MNDFLEGATEPGPPNIEPTPEQFAARWNQRTPEERLEWLANQRRLAQLGMDCWLRQHDHNIEQMAEALARVEQLCQHPDTTDTHLVTVDGIRAALGERQ
jgi:hypothetical protein